MPQTPDEELLAKVYAVTESPYVPYSGFPVGAALSLDNSTVVTGCNVENASYGSTNCAERTTMLRMVTEHGGNHKIAACVTTERKAIPYHPCGACRQVSHEFGCKRIIVESECLTDSGLGAPISIDFEKILPHVFGPEDLQVPPYSRP